ncbi:MAG: XRE family transcriptional regulator [Desulfobacterales bacterium]|nr:XRE family transcriptional regulator [Desulfobacterales bacterium]
MDEQSICQNIKALRLQHNLTLEELAQKTGLTKGYLSKVERSGKAPPYSTLNKIANALGMEVTTLLSESRQPPKDQPLFLSRAQDRPLIHASQQFAGYDYEILAEGKPGKNMEPFILHAPFDIPRLYQHEGEELIHILEGELEFHHGESSYILKKGDNIYFDAHLPHAGKSLGPNRAKLLVVIYFYKRTRGNTSFSMERNVE